MIFYKQEIDGKLHQFGSVIRPELIVPVSNAVLTYISAEEYEALVIRYRKCDPEVNRKLFKIETGFDLSP